MRVASLLVLFLFLIGITSISLAQKGWNHQNANKKANLFYATPTKQCTQDSLALKFSVSDSFDNARILSGDVNGDGFLEVAYAEDSVLRVYDHQGNIIQTDTSLFSNGRVGLLADMDNDNDLDIGVGTKNSSTLSISLIDENGNTLKTFSKTGGYDANLFPKAIIGNKLIAQNTAGFSTSPRGLSAFDTSSGNELWYYSMGPKGGRSSITDTDNDGDVEMVKTASTVHNGANGNGVNGNGTTTTDDNMWTIVIDEYGNEIYSQQFPPPKDGKAKHLFVDFNNNGQHDILALEEHSSFYPGTSQLHIIDAQNGNLYHTYDGISEGDWEVSVCQLDNDTLKEIVVSNYQGGNYQQYIFDETLQVQDSAGINGILAATNDLNGDGTNEIILKNYATLKILDSQLNLVNTYQVSGSIQDVNISDLDNNGVNEIVTLTKNGITALEYVPSQVTASFAASANTVCQNTLVQFTDSSSGMTSRTWYRNKIPFDTSQNTALYFSSLGKDTVSLVAQGPGGCKDTAEKVITVSTSPSVDFTADTVCVGDTTHFTDLSDNTIASWEWRFDDGDSAFVQNPSHFYQSAGVYNVTLAVTDSFGCTKTQTKFVQVYAKPKAGFAFDSSVCLGTVMNFEDTSSNPGSGYLTDWYWEYGDGNTSTQPNPSYLYNYPDTFNVFHRVKNNHGCTDTISDSLIVLQSPVVVASSDTFICYGDNTQLRVTGGDFYDWTPDSSLNNSSIDTPIATPSSTTTYSVTVSDTNGCQQTRSIQVEVNPELIFTDPNPEICEGDTTTLSVTGATSYWWVDGQTNDTISTDSFAVVSPQQTQQYYVIGEENGCFRSDTMEVTVHQPPTVSIVTSGPTAICEGKEVALTTNSSGHSYQWSNGQSGQPIWVATEDTYSVTVTDSNTCTTVLDTFVDVLTVPEANFGVEPVCFQEPSQFIDSSSAMGDSLVSWHWQFGDGSTDTVQEPEHIYPSDTNYTATLVVTNANGCQDTTQNTPVIYTLPQPDFSTQELCVDENYTFQNQTNVTQAPIDNWQWSFGDGDSASASSPTHSYDTAQTFNVSLTATDTNQCSNSKLDSLIVRANPVAKIGLKDTSDRTFGMGEEIQFINESSNYMDWLWDFDDNSLSTASNPTYMYTDSGSYDVALSTSNQYGCSDSDTVVLELIPLEEVYAGNAFSPNGDGVNDEFLAKGRGIKEFTMRIYNRWGDMIFKTDNMKEGWDGYYKGELQEADTYVYEIEAVGYSGKVIKKSGHFVLIR